MRAERALEVDIFGGDLVARAERMGIDVPVNLEILNRI